MTQLRRLAVSGNPLLFPPWQIIKEGTKALLGFLRKKNNLRVEIRHANDQRISHRISECMFDQNSEPPCKMHLTDSSTSIELPNESLTTSNSSYATASKNYTNSKMLTIEFETNIKRLKIPNLEFEPVNDLNSPDSGRGTSRSLDRLGCLSPIISKYTEKHSKSGKTLPMDLISNHSKHELKSVTEIDWKRAQSTSTAYSDGRSRYSLREELNNILISETNTPSLNSSKKKYVNPTKRKNGISSIGSIRLNKLHSGVKNTFIGQDYLLGKNKTIPHKMMNNNSSIFQRRKQTLQTRSIKRSSIQEISDRQFQPQWIQCVELKEKSRGIGKRYVTGSHTPQNSVTHDTGLNNRKQSLHLVLGIDDPDSEDSLDGDLGEGCRKSISESLHSEQEINSKKQVI